MERTPLALGLVGLCQFAPMFLLTLPAGDITDRFNQRRVYSLAAGLQALCSALFLSLEHFQAPYRLDVLPGAGAVRGGARLFRDRPAPRCCRSWCRRSGCRAPWPSARPSSPPPRSRDRRWAAFSMAWGRRAVYSLCIAGFIGAALIVSRLGGRRFMPEATEASRYERVAEGVRFVRSRPVVLGAISLDLFAVLLGGATALLPVYARDILHVGPMGLGFLRSAPAAGAFSMAFFLTHWPLEAAGRRQDVRRRRRVRRRHHRLRPFHLVSAFACWRCSCWAPPTW